MEVTFGFMSVELTQEVSDRLVSDHYGWLTTVAKSGQPVPRLIWFYYSGVSGAELTVYSMPRAAKVAHIKAHPQVSLNLDSDGNGGGIIVVGRSRGGGRHRRGLPRRRTVLGQVRRRGSEIRPDRGDEVLQHAAEDHADQSVDDADGLGAERVPMARIRPIFHPESTLGAADYRKSRDFEPTVRLMRPIRSATTVIAPLAFWT